MFTSLITFIINIIRSLTLIIILIYRKVENFMIIMSIDLGLVRTGLAICDKFEMLSSPLCVINETCREKLADKIISYAKQYSCELIVLGLPKNMDGSEGESAVRAKEFANIIKCKTNINVVMWDERCTTVNAHSYLNITNTRGKKRKQIIDSVSAVIILEDYIKFRKSKNSV